MGAFLKRLFIFFLLTLIAYPMGLIATAWLAPKFFSKNVKFRIGTNGHLHTRLRDLPVGDSLDLLFIGSSHVYRGFDTRNFEAAGLKTFNMGSSMQSPIQTLYLLNRFVDRLRPKMVVLDVFPGVFESDGVESSVDMIANDTLNRNTWLMASRVNNLITYNTLIYAFFRQSLAMDRNFREPESRDVDTYIRGGGYVARNMARYKYDSVPPRRLVFNPKQVKAFNEILDLLHSRRIPCLLTQVPITSELYQSYTHMDEMESMLSRSACYVDFNGKLPLDDSLHFYDADHLNQEGADLFNRSFLDTLAALKQRAHTCLVSGKDVLKPGYRSDAGGAGSR